MVDAGAEAGDQLQLRPRRVDHVAVDPVGDGRDQHVGLRHRGLQLLPVHRPVVEVQPGAEQLHHPRLDHVGQLAGDDHQGLLATGIGHVGPAPERGRDGTASGVVDQRAGRRLR